MQIDIPKEAETLLREKAAAAGMEVRDYIVHLAVQDETPVVYDEDRLIRLAIEGMQSGEPTAWTRADFEKTKADLITRPRDFPSLNAWRMGRSRIPQS
jgi:hypothetical protein